MVMYYIDILIYFRERTGHKINTDSLSGLLPPVEHSWTNRPPNTRASTGNGGDSRCDQPKLNLLCVFM